MKIYKNSAFDCYAVILPNVILIGSPCLKVGYQDEGKERPDGKPLGKQITLSGLSGDFKMKVCNHMPLPNFRLPKAYGGYGAQMGRSNTATGKCKLGKVGPVNNGLFYDNGGAYWGMGIESTTLYVAKSKKSWVSGHPYDETGFSFFWASSPFEAVKGFENMGLTF